MDKEIFEGIMQGANEVLEYIKATKEGRPIPKEMKITHYSTKSDIEIKPIRKKLGMSQRKFADTFGFAVDSIRNWESHRRTPDTSAQILLKVIAHNPNSVIEALNAN